MALLSFDTTSGQFVAPDTATIREQVANDWIAAFNTGDGSPDLDTEAATPAGQLIDAITAYIAEANSELLYLANQFNPLTAEGVFQDAIGYIYFMERKPAQPTSVVCTCTGLQGTVIPAGAQAQDTEGNRYQCAEAVTIPAGGTVSATFEALEVGAIDCPANTLNRIITVIAGWDTINNPASGVTGQLAESQADFERRRFESVASNAQGSVLALQGALDDIPGVTDCLVLENSESSAVTINGISVPAHSIAISIYGGDDSDIAQVIYQKKSAGCGTAGTTTVSHTDSNTGIVYTFNIIRPATSDLKITVTIDNTATLPGTYEADIQNAILADFAGTNTDSENTRIGIGQTVYASRFSTAVLLTAGVRSLRSITIALGSGVPGDFVTIPANVMPVLSAADITVVIGE